MNLFYEKSIEDGKRFLNEDESRHCIHVLRKQVGDQIGLMDGKGHTYVGRITEIRKKVCHFEILEKTESQPEPFHIHLAIAPTKNIDRMEWMTEKLGEIGVDEITFLKTMNGERSRLRRDRIEKKAISAMKQCGHPFLLKINDLVSFNTFLKEQEAEEKWIAHLEKDTHNLTLEARAGRKAIILIGPEGDFHPSEIELAKTSGYRSVSLGHTTLRTETAGLLACHLINVVNRW